MDMMGLSFSPFFPPFPSNGCNFFPLQLLSLPFYLLEQELSLLVVIDILSFPPSDAPSLHPSSPLLSPFSFRYNFLPPFFSFLFK